MSRKSSSGCSRKRERQGESIGVQVSDTGPAFPERAKENLFAAFKGSVRNGGTGLGLAIASELVRAHGGRIELADNSAGATFRIELPTAAQFRSTGSAPDFWRGERG